MDEPQAVLVTGAGGNLGGGIARAITSSGGRVALTDVRADPLDDLASSLPEDSVVGTWAADLTEDESVRDLVAAVANEAGSISACVNNAGVEQPVGPTSELDVDAVRRLYDINVFGVLRVTKEIIPLFEENGGGRIINIASGAGLSGTALMAPYNSSKHAVIGLTRSVALELADRGISVNAVCPGCIESPMMDRIESDMSDLSGQAVSFASDVPMGRFGTVDEVGKLVAYLALEAPVYITGAALVIDGGLNA